MDLSIDLTTLNIAVVILTSQCYHYLIVSDTWQITLIYSHPAELHNIQTTFLPDAESLVGLQLITTMLCGSLAPINLTR